MNIENYNTLYTIFLVLTFVFLIMDIILFFAFDIRKIISVKTGYAKKQSIKETNQINQTEDNKRRKRYKGSSFKMATGELISEQLISEQLKSQELRRQTNDLQIKQAQVDGTTVLQTSSDQGTVLLNHDEITEEMQGTVVLSQNQKPEETQGTVVLSQSQKPEEIQGTVVLSQSQIQEEKEGTIVLNAAQQYTCELVQNQNNNIQKYVFKAGEFFEIAYSEMKIPSENIIR